jgi:uncharacterized protein
MSTDPLPLGWDLAPSPFHPGELAIQRRVGVVDKIDAQGRRSVRRYLTEQHRAFFALLPYAFVGTVDARGQPWASMIAGDPGFIAAPDAHRLEVAGRPLFGDPLNETLRDGAGIALLGVQLPTRRRNRAIGVVERAGPNGFAIAVRQTLGVCPQYIQGRDARFTADPRAPEPRPVHRATTLDAAARAIIEKADTFFVASVDPREEDGEAAGPDVAHRGGRPGFVRVDEAQTLTTPDFVGNFMFNTLGNFLADDRAGLFFPDFETGDTLYIAARAEVIWDGPELAAFVGAQRLVRYHVTDVIRVERALPLAFSAPDWSPLLARTGTWAEADAAIAAERDRNVWRPFRITRIEAESDTVRSFYLEPADGGGRAGYRAGQFLPVRVEPPGWAEPVTRTYTLSDAPGGIYRISIKREGRGGVSDWLHDQAAPGTPIEAMAPRGSFTFETPPNRAVVLVSAGVGITPMLAMLNDLLVNDGRTRHHAPIWFVHGARNAAGHAFAGHMRRKAELHANLHVHTAYSEPSEGDAPDSIGRIDVALLKRVLPFDDYDFYLCGPPGFMQGLYDGLRDLNVPDARIRFESFGPASVARRPDAAAASDEEAVRVDLAKSGKVLRWRPSDGSLLDTVERAGVAVLSSCRSGVCGTCATRLLKGAVEYPEPPAHEIAEGEALICVARPRAGAHLDDSADREGVTLDL